ncbi:MAG: phytoene/squalene synthase family protein [Pseudomonadota bacterium]
MLREGDRDRYLCALLVPENVRGSFSALYAFNLEIARIRESVSDPMLGELRLQWWRDVIGGKARGDAMANPVAAALIDTMYNHALQPGPLLNMIDARQFDLYDDPMPDRNTFEGYAGETASTLIQMSVNAVDPQSASGTGDAAGHAGVAQLVAGTLLLLPTHRARGQIFVPGDILDACGLDRDGFLAAKQTDRIGNAVQGFIALGREHLAAARYSMEAVPKSAFAAFLPAATVQQVFDKAEKLGGAILEQPLAIPQWRRQWRFWRAARRGRI